MTGIRGRELENLVGQCKIHSASPGRCKQAARIDTSVIEMEGERVSSISVAERIGGIDW